MTETHARYPDYMEDQRVFFDELVTRDLDAYHDAAWDASRRSEVERLFALVAPSRVLDVGCGCGFHDVVMADRPGVEEVVGIDYSEKSVELAEREYSHPRVARRVADIFAMPPGRFDLAVSFQVIEHLTDPAGFLRACARQVRPGGWVAVATPNRRRVVNRLVPLLGRAPLLEDPQHFQEFTQAELQAIGESVGLRHHAAFGYGLTLFVPRLDRQVIPTPLGRRLGPQVPSVADRLCQVFGVVA